MQRIAQEDIHCEMMACSNKDLSPKLKNTGCIFHNCWVPYPQSRHCTERPSYRKKKLAICGRFCAENHTLILSN